MLLGQLSSDESEETSAGAAEALSIIQRYVRILEDGVHSGSLPEIAKAAALLTTVSKGLGDMAWPEAYPMVSAASTAVLCAAVKVGQAIRITYP